MLRLARQNGWGVAFDQCLSSISNVLILVAAALSLPKNAFSAFALVQLLVVGCVAMQRAVLLEPSMALRRGSSSAGITWRWLAYSSALGGVLCAAAALVLGLVSSLEAVLVGLCAAAILIQDSMRYSAFARRALRRAIAADAIWTGAGLIALMLQPKSLSHLLLCWLGGALVSLACFRPFMMRQVNKIQWRTIRALSAWSATEAGLALLTVALPLYVGSVIEGQQSAGNYRLLQALAGPLNIAHVSITVVLLQRAPELVNRDALAVLRRRVPVMGGLFAASAFAYMVVGGLLVAGVVSGNHRPASVLVPILAVAAVTASGGWSSPRLGGLKALGMQRQAVRPRVVSVGAIAVAALVVSRWNLRIFGDATAPILLAYGLANVIAWHWTWRKCLHGHDTGRSKGADTVLAEPLEPISPLA